MKNERILTRAAVYMAAPVIWFSGNARADFSTSGVLGFLTGLPTVGDYVRTDRRFIDRPANLADETGTYLEFFGSRQEVVRSFSGPEKDIGHGAEAFGLHHRFRSGKAGMYMSWGERSSSVSWPFYGERVRISDVYYSRDAVAAGFVKPNDRIVLGAAFGKSVGKSDGWMYSMQAVVKPYREVKAELRYSSLPYDRVLDAEFDGITHTLYSRYRYDAVEGTVTVPVPGIVTATFSVRESGISTPSGFRGDQESHAQVWNADHRSRGFSLLEEAVPFVKLSAGYSRDSIPGDVSMWFNGKRYMTCETDITTDRVFLEAEWEKHSRFVPAIRYDRVETDVELSHGSADSWAFTPKQIEVIGVLTWSVSATGRLVSHGCTFSWALSKAGLLSASVFRLFPDYRLRIVTRDHLSLNPWYVIFGRRRYETDRTRYYDFGSILFTKRFDIDRFAVLAGVQQLVPIRHAEKEIPGKAPAPPSFPTLKFQRPSRYGGLSFSVSVQYSLR